MEIDVDGLIKQIEESNRNSKEYVKVEIIVSKDNPYPYAYYNSQNVGDSEIAILLNALQEIEEIIIKSNPNVLKLLNNTNINYTVIQKKGGDKNASVI